MARRTETFEARFIARDELSPSVASARRSIRGLRTELQTLRGQGSGPSAVTEKLSKDLGTLSAQSDRAAAAQRRLQRQVAAGQSTRPRSLLVEVRARRAMVSVLNKEAAARRKNELLRRRGLNASGQSAQAVASDKLARSLQRQQAAQAEVNQRRAAGLPVSAELAKLARTELGLADARAIAEQRVADVKLRQLLAQQEIVARQAAGLRVSKQLRSEAEGFEGAIKRTSRTGNSLFFTFRRLVGVLATFTLARNFFGGLRSGAVDAAKFGGALEIAELSIQTILTATGEVRNSLGQTIPLAEQFEANLAGARRQIANVRKDSLNTLATFSQLTDTFQVGLAPGRNAGLSIDQVQDFTVQISQAATAFGVAQNQLSEEIRSLLRGTITNRNTRIATALGISNADIKRARQTGQLAAFLQDRFAAFDETASKARKTLSGVFLQLRGAAEIAVLDASSGFLEQLKQSASGLLENVVAVRDANGDLSPRPEFVAFLRAIFDQYEAIAEKAGEFLQNLDLGDAAVGIRQVAEVFRNLFEVLGSVAAVVARITTTFSGFVTAVARALGTTNDSARQFLATIIALRLVLGAGLIKSLAAAAVGINSFQRGVDGAGSRVQRLRGRLNSAVPSFIAVSAAIAAAVNTLTSFSESSGESSNLVSTFGEIERAAVRVGSAIQQATDPDQVERLRERLDALKNKQAEVVAQYQKLLDRQIQFDSQSTLTKTGRGALSFFGFDDEASRFISDSLVVEFDKITQAAVDSGNALTDAAQKTNSALTIFRANIAPPSSDIKGFVADVRGQIDELDRSSRAISRLRIQDPFELTGFTAEQFEAQLRVEDEKLRISQALVAVKQREAAITEDLSKSELARVDSLIKAQQSLDQEGLSDSDRQKIQKIVAQETALLSEQTTRQKELAEIAGKLLTERSQSLSLKRDEITLEGALRELVNQQLEDIISQNTALAKRNNLLAKAENSVAFAENQRDEAGLQQTGEGRRRAAAANLKAAQANLELSKISSGLEIQRLETQVAQASQYGAERAILQRQLDLRIAGLSIAERQLAIAVKQSEIENQRANQGGVERAGRGFLSQLGGDADGTEVSDRLDAGLERLTTTFLTTVSRGLADSIIEALSGGDVEAVFASLGDTLVRSFIQELADQAVGSAVSGVLSVFSGAGTGTGFAEGGAVPSAGTGGVAPPTGVDSRDRIAAFLRPGEHVMPPEAVSKYSRKFMSMVQHGTLDPSLAKALMGGGGRSSGRSTRGTASFAKGGGVGRNTSLPGRGRTGSAAPNTTLLLADAQAMDRFMSGGGDRHIQRVAYRSGQYRRALGI